MKKTKAVIISILAVLILLCGCYCGYRFIKHEKAQSQQLQEMRASISKLSEEVKLLSEEDVEWLDGL